MCRMHGIHSREVCCFITDCFRSLLDKNLHPLLPMIFSIRDHFSLSIPLIPPSLSRSPAPFFPPSYFLYLSMLSTFPSPAHCLLFSPSLFPHLSCHLPLHSPCFLQSPLTSTTTLLFLTPLSSPYLTFTLSSPHSPTLPFIYTYLATLICTENSHNLVNSNNELLYYRTYD